MADIPVKFQAEGNLAAEAAKAAAGMSKLAAQEEKVAAIAKVLGKDVKAVEQGIRAEAAAVKMVQQEEAKREKAALKAIRDKKKAEKELEKQQIQAAKGMTRLERAHEAAFKKTLGDYQALLKGDLTPLVEGLGAKAALPVALAGALATGLLVAGAAAAALLTTITALALSAGTARDNTKAMLDVLTAGRGDETLRLLDGLAKQLGVSITDTREKFIEFRKAGLDNKQSTSLIKLQADLEATGLSAKDAEAGIKKIVDQAKKADGSFDGKIFDEAFKKIASQAGVAGDGLTAMTKKAKSLNGALASLDNSKTQALEAIYDAIKPKVDAAAQAVAGFVKTFLESEKGKAAIESISSAIGGLLSLIPTLIDKGVALYQTLSAFSDSTTGKIVLEGLKVTLYAVGAAMAVAAGAVGLLLAPLYAVGAAVVYVTGLFAGLAKDAVNLGTNIIQGLIGGIKNAAGALYATVSGIASGVKSTFKSILGIASPSKEFEKLGVFTGKGLEIGLEKSVPDSADLAGNMIPAALGPSPTAPQASSSNSQSISIGDIIVQVQGGTDASPEDLARAIRREVAMLLSAYSLSRGVPA